MLLNQFMKHSKFVIFIENLDYPASLEKRKIYEVLPDSEADKIKQIRVIDEWGEDYLFPAEYFVEVNLSEDSLAAVV